MNKLPGVFRSLRQGRRFVLPLAAAPVKNVQRIVRHYSATAQTDETKSTSMVTSYATTDDDNDNQYEEGVKSRILDKSLDFVAAKGWSVDALAAGAEAAGYPGVAHGLFPNGGADLIHHFNVTCNKRLVEAMASWPKEELKESEVPVKFIENAIMERLMMIDPYRSTWPKAMAIQALPNNVPNSLATLLSLVDDICYHSGDRSVDFNWYLRRVGLAGIYKATELFYLTDNSPDRAATRSFVQSRVRDAQFIQAALSLNPSAAAAAAPQTLSAAFVTAKTMLGLNTLK